MVPLSGTARFVPEVPIQHLSILTFERLYCRLKTKRKPSLFRRAMAGYVLIQRKGLIRRCKHPKAGMGKQKSQPSAPLF